MINAKLVEAVTDTNSNKCKILPRVYNFILEIHSKMKENIINLLTRPQRKMLNFNYIIIINIIYIIHLVLKFIKYIFLGGGGGRGGSSKIKGGRRGSKHREPTEEGYPEDNKTYGSQGLSRWESFGLSQILAQVESISNI